MKNPQIDTLLQAARATNIPAAWSGGWFVEKTQLKLPQPVSYRGGIRLLSPGIYTALFRMTDSTMMNWPPGEVVMEDTPFELKTHLEFMLKARGSILVTGLGLGCVTRGLLANPAVNHVTCIEKSADVLKLVQPYMPQTNRLSIIHADALEWTTTTTQTFDYAWHDIWSNRDAGEPHLDELHTHLIFNCRDKVRNQGAWKYAREAKRFLAAKQMKLMA
jgi:hypothetical protein